MHHNLHAAIEIHAVDTDSRIIFDTQVDMLTDAKPKVARLGEIPFPQLILLNFETTFEDFLGFRTTDGDMDGDFLVTTDAECADGVAGFACGGGFVRKLVFLGKFVEESEWKRELTVDGCLTTELFEHFCSTGESVARFADGDIEDDLLDAELAHRVCALVFLGFCLLIKGVSSLCLLYSKHKPIFTIVGGTVVEAGMNVCADEIDPQMPVGCAAVVARRGEPPWRRF